MKKHGFHLMSVELWFHIMIRCHPKMVSPGAGRPPSYASDLELLIGGDLLQNHDARLQKHFKLLKI